MNDRLGACTPSFVRLAGRIRLTASNFPELLMPQVGNAAKPTTNEPNSSMQRFAAAVLSSAPSPCSASIRTNCGR